MKKLIAFIGMIILLLTVFWGCGDAGKSGTEPLSAPEAALESAAEEATEASAEVPMYFRYKDVNIALDMPMADLLAALPDARHYTEQTSCAFDGLDKTFDYGSFVIQTYPKGGEDFVLGFWFMDDTVETPEGAYIGMTGDQAAAVYGEDTFNGDNAYIVESGSNRMTVIISDGLVSSIQYTVLI